MLAADGTPLKRSLHRALRRQKLRALALIAPLLVFILVSFVGPIADMLFRSVENQIVSETLPRTVLALEEWQYASGQAPGEDVFAALYVDLAEAREFKVHTRLGSRLNYEVAGASSLFRKSGRGLRRMDTDIYREQLAELDPVWESPSHWVDLFSGPGVADVLPETSSAWESWKRILRADDAAPDSKVPDDFVFTMLYRDLVRNPVAFSSYSGPSTDQLRIAADAAVEFETVSIRDQFIDMDDGWSDIRIWGRIQSFAPAYTEGYFLSSVDLQKTPEGVRVRPENERIYITLFLRTLFMSLAITGACLLLGYPVAWLLATLPLRTSNILLILVLLPFWTSLLVRTSAWKVLLQQQGVINDLLVSMGFVADDARLIMINNQFGTIVAMTHILLPFMILPLYSVMKTIPPSYVRAAKSLGATDWTAFWRVYFPLSVPGIGAGCILVFILAIGYYITPELVGGRTGTFISNRIAYHISTSLNWGLAAALGTLLLAAVLMLYWIYDRVVGIDNVKLG